MTINNTKKIIGASLKFWRKQSGFSQADISVDLDIPRSTYESYESGKAEPSILVLKTLASIYNLTIEQLIDVNSILETRNVMPAFSASLILVRNTFNKKIIKSRFYMEEIKEKKLTTEEIEKRLAKDKTYGTPGNPIMARFRDHQELGYGLTFCEPLAEGMARFDLHFGFWEAREEIIDPFSKQKLILLWEFVPSGKGPCRTGIPMHVNRVEQINKANRCKLGNVQTQQLMPAGEVIQIFDEVPNPYEAKAVGATKLAKKTW